MAKKYAWGGGAKKHSISEAQHKKNVATKNRDRAAEKQYGINPSQPLEQPLTSGQAYAQSVATADREYGPQLQATKQLQQNVPVWYAQFMASAAAQQTAAQQQAQPYLDAAQAGVQNAGATTAGLDPNSPQAAADAQAAKGRQTLAQNSANTLAGGAQATDAYFGGQQTIAARELPQVRAGLVQQYGQQQGQRAAAVTDAYGKARTNEQNYGIARETLNLNTVNTVADNAQNAADSVQAAKDKKAARVVSRKNTRDRVAAQTVRTQTAATNAATKAAEKEATAKAKKTQTIKKATGKIRSKVESARSDWELLSRKRNPVIDPKTQKPTGKTVGPTPDQIKSELRKRGYTPTEIHVMLLLRVGKSLTPAEIKALRDQDPDFRVPAEWRKTKPKPKTKSAPDGYGGSRPT